MKFFPSLLFVILNLYSFSISAQSKLYKGEFGFRSDNDAYLAKGQDRYYTNGLFITYRRAMDQSLLKGRVNKRIWEAEAGQKMYNPISGKITRTSRIDRPFAAYLYAGGSLSWFYNSENSLKITVQGGTIGPSALGKEAQVFLHKIVGFYEVQGWETQVKNELGLNTIIEYNRFLNRNKSKTADLTINSYADIGNTFSGAGAGIMFRAGILNQLFNSASTNSAISNNPASIPLHNKEFFFYTKSMLHFIAYDASSEGGLFREDKGLITFDVKPLVFSQELGVIYSKNRYTANFSVIFNSREIKSVAKRHQYGSIALYYRII